MQRKWIVLLLALTLLLAGCGKKDKAEETFNYGDTPILTEAAQDMTPITEPQWETVPAVPVTTAAAVAEETEAPTEAPTEPKADPSQDPVNQTVYVLGRVNVRNGAGFNSKVIGQLKGGDTVKRTGIGKNGWSQIIYEGQTAYVANNYVSTDSPEKANGATFEEVNQTVRATDKVNIRSGPGVDYDVIGQLKAGEEVNRTAIGSKGWSRILYNGEKCYVSNSYLRTVKVDKVEEKKEDKKEDKQTTTELEPVG